MLMMLSDLLIYTPATLPLQDVSNGDNPTVSLVDVIADHTDEKDFEDEAEIDRGFQFIQNEGPRPATEMAQLRWMTKKAGASKSPLGRSVPMAQVRSNQTRLNSRGGKELDDKYLDQGALRRRSGHFAFVSTKVTPRTTNGLIDLDSPERPTASFSRIPVNVSRVRLVPDTETAAPAAFSSMGPPTAVMPELENFMDPEDDAALDAVATQKKMLSKKRTIWTFLRG
ncbi:unnamed protein product [Symbiodinium necroappetens]|uniref:Uncharacterized protein n=1 Tax=Symbiodinium necroappetens TaxID=1628268 RepID=A0A813BSR4_9DINO|nr:unnamed protein product [Symbiodinium necroappetens]